jgi:cellobiose-specific phosphotransferase system component IIC
MEAQKQKPQNNSDELLTGCLTFLLLAVPTMFVWGSSLWLFIGDTPANAAVNKSDLQQWLNNFGGFILLSLPLSALAACVFISKLTSIKWKLGKLRATLASLALTTIAITLIWISGWGLVFLSR